MPYIAVRNPLDEAKTTLSSWDKCMEKTYCKWPVIVAIIVGSLIILSVVLCVARCICCGAECAMCCCKCCTGCCGSSSKGSGHKRMQSEPAPMYPNQYQSPIAPPPIDNRPVNQQYRSHAAPTFNPAPEPERPQFATFESPSKPVNEDALPAMPSWNEAKSTQVEEEVIPEKRGDMEMDRLNHNGSVNSVPLTGAAAIPPGRRTPGRSPVQRSPTQDSYGFPPGYQNDSFGSGAPQHRNSPGPYANHFAQQEGGYRGMSPVQNLSPVYGAGAGYAQNQPYGRRSPGARPVQQFDSPGARHSPAPRPMNDYGYGAPDRSNEAIAPPYHAQAPVNDYPLPAPMRSPSPQYAPSGSTRFESSTPAPAYPGQQTYDAGQGAYPGQQTYQAYQPTPEPQQPGMMRKPVDGTWKEI